MADSRSGFGSLVGLLLIAAAAFGLRLAVAQQTHPVSLRGDETYYLNVAQELASGNGHVHVESAHMRAWHPPGHPWLMSRFLGAELTTERLQPVAQHLHWLQCGLGALVVLLCGLIARTLFGPRAGLLAAVACAVHPTWVAFGHYFWAEPLFTSLTLAGILGTIHLARTRRFAPAALTGVVFGLAALTRELAVVAAAAAMAWLVLSAPATERRAAFLRAACAVAFSAAVVLPWSFRNLRVLDRFVPISTIGWLAAAEGNTLGDEDWTGRWEPEQVHFRQQYNGIADELGRAGFAKEFAQRKVSAAQPLWIGHKLLRTPALLLTPDTPLLYKLREGRYGPLPVSLVRGLMGFSFSLHVLVVALAALALAALPRARLPLAIFGAVFLMHTLLNGHARFRLPWVPLAIACAAGAAVDVRGALRSLSGRGKLLLGLFALLFAAVCLPLDRVALAEQWSGASTTAPEEEWEAGFAALSAFVEREGHALVPQPYEEAGYPLSRWVREQRRNKRSGVLGDERAGRLEDLPQWTWQGRRQE